MISKSFHIPIINLNDLHTYFNKLTKLFSNLCLVKVLNFCEKILSVYNEIKDVYKLRYNNIFSKIISLKIMISRIAEIFALRCLPFPCNFRLIKAHYPNKLDVDDEEDRYFPKFSFHCAALGLIPSGEKNA